jgi:selenide,water dikinase
VGPGDLSDILEGLPLSKHPNLLVGLEVADDAGVYKLSERLAIIQSVDFFTPIVDDPHLFGQIAAANALSDIYAMGGKPLTAMNIVCFPTEKFDKSVLKEILAGGVAKLHEADCLLIGGHTVDDTELKYGLAVTGIVHPKKITTRSSARAGDKLILTKPIGTGVISTAVKAGLARAQDSEAAADSMAQLNRTASEALEGFGVKCVTDITGFGLIGHASEIALASNVAIVLSTSSIPLLSGALENAKMGLLPAGAHRNRQFYSCNVIEEKPVSPEMLDLFYDPQTSGGLLICVPAKKAEDLLRKLQDEGVSAASIVGEVRNYPQRKLIITG